ncbi:MAG: thiamine diphosphokinase, partial [Clostridiales bacterium]|nr:thiamine diphosphokinase [Clostridiales bacterium]
MKKAVIVLNGQYIPETLDDGFVICADGGCGLLRGAGLRPDIIIGDGDSMPPFYDIYSGVKSIKYPADKDMTDGEICVRYAAAEGFGDVVIYGA